MKKIILLNLVYARWDLRVTWVILHSWYYWFVRRTWEQRVLLSWKYPFWKSQYSRVVISHLPLIPIQHGRPIRSHSMWRYAASEVLKSFRASQICQHLFENFINTLNSTCRYKTSNISLLHIIIEVFRNTQGWQCWHYCTTSSGGSRIAQTGEEGAPIPEIWAKTYYLVIFFAKNCMKMKEIGSRREGDTRPQWLDPPMTSNWNKVQLYV